MTTFVYLQDVKPLNLSCHSFSGFGPVQNHYPQEEKLNMYYTNQNSIRQRVSHQRSVPPKKRVILGGTPRKPNLQQVLATSSSSLPGKQTTTLQPASVDPSTGKFYV